MVEHTTTRCHKQNATLGGHFGKADLKSGNEVTPGHVPSFGVPKILHIKTIDQSKENAQVLGTNLH